MFGSPSNNVRNAAFIDFTPRAGLTNNPPSVSWKPAGTETETNTRTAPNSASLSRDQEYHAAVVFDSLNHAIHLYINGALADSVNGWDGTVGDLGITSENYFGAAVFFGDRDMAAKINEIRIWSGAMPARQVAASAAYGANSLPPEGRTYADWVADNPGAEGQTMDQDHDNDGVPNGIEYLLGTVNDGFTSLPVPGADGSMHWTADEFYFGSYGTDYVVEVSDNLVDWDPVPLGATPLGTLTISGTNISYLAPNLSGPRGFVRLRVSGP